MISFLPVASEWTGQWGASFWSGLDIVGHVLGKVRKLCGGGWIEAKKGHYTRDYPALHLRLLFYISQSQ
jgi:hypothetical protein